MVDIRAIQKANQKITDTMISTSKIKYYNCSGCGQNVFDAELYTKDLETLHPVKVGCLCWQKDNDKKILEVLFEEDKRYKQERAKRLLQESKLGRRFTECRFENYEVYPEVTALYTSFTEYLNEFAQHRDKGEGLFIRGSNGIGKTHLTAALVKELTDKGYSCMFVMVPELLEDLRGTFDKAAREDAEPTIKSIDYMDRLQTADLLILDDIGAQKPSEWAQERLFLIIDKRYRDMRPIIYTSNCEGSELRGKIGIRSVSRILETSKIISVQANDYRELKKESREGKK